MKAWGGIIPAETRPAPNALAMPAHVNLVKNCRLTKQNKYGRPELADSHIEM